MGMLTGNAAAAALKRSIAASEALPPPPPRDRNPRRDEERQRRGGRSGSGGASLPRTTEVPLKGWLARRREVEARPLGDGFESGWLAALVVKHDEKAGRVLVRFKELLADNETDEENGARLEEELSIDSVRPVPPQSSYAGGQRVERGTWCEELRTGAPVECFKADAWWSAVFISATPAQGTRPAVYAVRYLKWDEEEPDLPADCIRPAWTFTHAPEQLWTLNEDLVDA